LSEPPGPYTFAATPGNLPPGISLSTAGALSGTPTADGLFNFTVTATNSTAETGSLAYTLGVLTPVPLVIGGKLDGAAQAYTPDANGLYGTTAPASLSPFAGFTGQIRSATADLNGDGKGDAVLVTG